MIVCWSGWLSLPSGPFHCHHHHKYYGSSQKEWQGLYLHAPFHIKHQHQHNHDQICAGVQRHHIHVPCMSQQHLFLVNIILIIRIISVTMTMMLRFVREDSAAISYSCLSPCVYERDDQPGTAFCFAQGDQQVMSFVCLSVCLFACLFLSYISTSVLLVLLVSFRERCKIKKN